MKQSRRHLAVSILVGLGLAAVAITIAAPKTEIHAQNHLRISLTTDWSHRHMIFTAPDSITTAWRLQGVSRYQQQWFRRYGLGGRPDVVRPDRGLGELSEENDRELRPDWGQSLPALTTATSSAPGEEVFPAKFSFDINATPSCTNDFIVYPTGAAGSGVAIAASATGFFSERAATGSTITITNPASGNTLVMTAGTAARHTGAGAGTFARSMNTTTQATDLAAGINFANNGSYVGVTASSNGATVTITAMAGSAGNTITAVSSTAGRGTDASNFTWNATNTVTLAGGADGTASIMALNNLYAGTGGSCGAAPTTYWTYDTGGTVVTSPVLSPDGTQVAFVQTVSGVANLVVLKWSASATFATLTSNPAFPDCTAPCMISIPFGNGASDTMSSPFYAYGLEVIYVGDDAGVLHKFSNVFNQVVAPAEVTTSWPITVHSGAELTGPVFDVGSGNVFVADADGTVSYVRETTSLSTIGGACASGAAPCLGTPQVALTGTIVDPPTVDGTNETVFVFDGGGSKDVVWQGDTALMELSSVTLTGSAGNAEMRAGDFDNTYYNAAAGSGDGKLYFCGVTSAANEVGLFRVSFAAASHGEWGTISEMDTAVDIRSGGGTASSLQLVGANKVETSPLTEVYNTASNTDWLFLSVGNSANTPNACSTVGAGCIMSFELSEPDTGGRWPPAAATDGVAVQAGPKYTSGSFAGDTASATGPIVIDNVAAATGAGNEQFSNIYFLWLTNATNTQNGHTTPTTFGMCNGIVDTGGCAVKLTQAALQ